MSLTVGTAPFGTAPGGTWNRETPEHKGLIYFEDFPRRVRAEFAGETVVDSRNAKLLHEHGLLPVLYFPAGEVRTDLFVPSGKRTHCPWKGDASHWSIDVAGRTVEDAVWEYRDPLDGAPPVKGHFAFYWGKLDRWFEEDEEMIGHVRDPYTRVDVLDSSRHVRVSVDGLTLADTKRAKALFETGLPARWYVPLEDVALGALTPSGGTTTCAYKGYATTLSARVNGEVVDGIAWTYPDPRREVERIRGHVCFLNEHVDIELDGEPQERPVTKFSRR